MTLEQSQARERALCTELCRRLQTLHAAHGEFPSHETLITHLGLTQDELHQGYALGTWQQLKVRRWCSFCQFVLDVIRDHRREPACIEIGQGDVVGVDGDGDDEAEFDSPPGLGEDTIKIFVFPDEACLRLSYPSQLGTRLMFVAEGTTHATIPVGPFTATEIHPEPISPKLVKGWLSQCDRNHGDACRHVPEKFVSQRVLTGSGRGALSGISLSLSPFPSPARPSNAPYRMEKVLRKRFGRP